VSRFDSIRVLLVEDHPVIRGLLTRQLGLLGFEVDAVSDAESALECAARAGYPIVLTDLGLPGMGGEELVRRLRERCRENVCMPVVIAVTGESEPEAHSRLREAGVDHVLVKPVDMESLKALLHGWLDGALPAAASPLSCAGAEALPPDLDPGVLWKVLGEEGADDAVRLIRLFVESARAGMEGAARAIEAREARHLKRFLHRQWSAAGAIGAMRFAMLAGRIESAVAAGDWGTVQDHWPGLQATLSTVESLVSPGEAVSAGPVAGKRRASARSRVRNSGARG
jgi:DNA-binding response OmpR family regulator